MAPIRELLDEGHTIGLGTDVSGGFHPSILENVRHAVWTSRCLSMREGRGEGVKISTEEALWLATRGGARVVGLQDRVGGFEVGMEWDAQMVDMGDVVGGQNDGAFENGPVDVFGWESWADRVEKWVYSGDDRNTVAVWVRGRLVHKTRRYGGAVGGVGVDGAVTLE